MHCFLSWLFFPTRPVTAVMYYSNVYRSYLVHCMLETPTFPKERYLSLLSRTVYIRHGTFRFPSRLGRDEVKVHRIWVVRCFFLRDGCSSIYSRSRHKGVTHPAAHLAAFRSSTLIYVTLAHKLNACLQFKQKAGFKMCKPWK